MKKFLALTLALVMSLSLVACGSKNEEPKTDDTSDTQVEEPTEGAYKIAMITDYGDITDQSFNQTTYEACKAFSDDNGLEFSYFKPAGDNTADRVAMIEKAADEGYNVIDARLRFRRRHRGGRSRIPQREVHRTGRGQGRPAGDCRCQRRRVL